MSEAAEKRLAIVSELTPGGRGAICVLHVQSPNVIDQVGRFFCSASGRPLHRLPQQTPLYGRWYPVGRADHEQANDLEDVIVCVRDTSTLEVHCHGGQFAKQRIVGDLQSIGFTQTDWKDLGLKPGTSSAAELELVNATTKKAAAVLLWQCRGALKQTINQICSEIGTGKKDLALTKIEELLRWEPLGLHLTRPWQIVIMGRPNVGKSSVINRLLGYDRSIVNDQPGTTRDVLSSETAIAGWPVQFFDTAGLHAASDEIERAGIELARQRIAQADLVMLVVDIEQTADECRIQLADLTDHFAHQPLTVVNKCDLGEPMALADEWVKVSAKTGEGFECLLNLISARMVPHEPTPGQAIPFLVAQYDQLRTVREKLLRGEDLSALQSLDVLLSPAERSNQNTT